MLPVAGRPLLEHLLEWLRSHGVREIGINLHHCPHVITEYFGVGGSHGVSITYSLEDELLGTAGAAKRMQPFLDQRFVVAYGDVLTNVDLGRLAACHTSGQEGNAPEPAVTMALYRVPDPTQCGIVGLDEGGQVTRFVEKPAPHEVFSDLAFSGVMVCEPFVLDYVPPGTPFDFGFDLLPVLLEQGVSVRGIEILPSEYMVDIGTLSGYLRALRTFSARPADWQPTLAGVTRLDRGEAIP